MKNTKTWRIFKVFIFALFCFSLPPAGHAAIILVNCTIGDTIQSPVDRANG